MLRHLKGLGGEQAKKIRNRTETINWVCIFGFYRQLRSKFSTLDNTVIVKSNTTWNVWKYLLFSNYNCSSKNVMLYGLYNAFTGKGSQIQSYKRYIPYQKSYFYKLNFRTLGTKKPIVLRSEKSNIRL